MIKSDCLIIIPAYNEEASIEAVVEDLIIKYPEYDYVIINDGSVDKTRDICLQRGFNILDLPINLGLSGAFQTGIKYAYEMGYEYAIQYDGDGQHQAKYVESMLEEIHKGYDIVIGSRFIKHKKRRFSPKNIGNAFLSLSIKLVTGQRITDATSGMRLFNRRMMRLFAENLNFTPEPDTIAYLIKCGAKVSEVHVKMQDRSTGESYLNFGTSIYYMLRVCASIFFIQWFRPRLHLIDGEDK